MMLMRESERLRRASRHFSHSSIRQKSLRKTAPQRIRIEAPPVSDPSRAFAPVSQWKSDLILGASGYDQDRRANLGTFGNDVDPLPVAYGKRFGRFRSELSRVFPRQFRDRSRQLLKPAIVREASVPYRSVRLKRDQFSFGMDSGQRRPEIASSG